MANDTEDKEHLAFLRLLGKGWGEWGLKTQFYPLPGADNKSFLTYEIHGYLIYKPRDFKLSEDVTSENQK